MFLYLPSSLTKSINKKIYFLIPSFSSTSETYSCTRPSTRSSTAWAASQTQPPTSGSGRSAWRMQVSDPPIRVRVMVMLSSTYSEVAMPSLGSSWLFFLRNSLHLPGQPYGVALASCRTVGSALDYGDEHRPPPARLGRTHRGLYHLCCIRCADGSHPAGHGGALCFPARPAAALVRTAGCRAGQLGSSPDLLCDVSSSHTFLER